MIRTSNIAKSFGSIVALEDVSIEVPTGAITGVLGPNGSGKSTLFRILLGLTPADGGEVHLGGVTQPRGASDERRRIAFVPDSDDLYEDLSVEEFARVTWRLHVRFAALDARLPFPDERFERLCDVFELTDHVGRRSRSLSHGMRRKTQLVAALTCRPEVLVIDEPTNGLDPDQHVVLRLVLRSLADNGSTILMSTHNLGFAEALCDHVILLRSRVALSGTPDEVRATTASSSLAEAYERSTGLDRGDISRRADAAFR